MSAADIPLREIVRRLKATVSTLVDIATNTAGGVTIHTYETKEDLLDAAGADFTLAYTSNFNPGDGNKALWIKADDPTLVPNGLDALQLDDGTVVLRYFARESLGSTPSVPSGTPYSVSIPLSFETLADFHNSTITAPCVILADANGQGKMWLRDNTLNETGTVDVDWIVNASGIHYRFI